MKHRDTRQDTIGHKISRKVLINLDGSASPSNDERHNDPLCLTSGVTDDFLWDEITFQINVVSCNIRAREVKKK